MVYIKNEVLEINGKKIALNGILRQKLDNIKKIIKKKWDFCFQIDGNERSGKTTLGLICAWYLSDGKITINNLCKSSEEALDKIEKFKRGDVLLVDESSLIFNSADSTTKELKRLSKILDICGFKGIIFILICPAFYKLKWDIAVRRSKFLLHVYTQRNWNRGYFAYFGEKKKKGLFHYAIKHYGSYKQPSANFNGTFNDFNPFGEKYDKLKEETLLEQIHKDEKEKKVSKEKYDWIKTQADIALYYLSQYQKQQEISNNFKKLNYNLRRPRVSEAINQVKFLKNNGLLSSGKC